MFTLKLYRRLNGQLTTKIMPVSHVVVHEVNRPTDVEGKCHLLEINAFTGPHEYTLFFVGQVHPNDLKDSIADPHGYDDKSLWGWGLLENWEGNTTQHFRPASYG